MAEKKPKSQNKDRTPEPFTFEQQLSDLEQAVARLEGGDLTLEDAIQCYERAFHSWKNCARILQSAQRRIEVLCEDQAGDPDASSGEAGLIWKPLSLKSLRDLEIDADGREPSEGSRHQDAAGEERATAEADEEDDATSTW
ncbi:MAG: exodeoxyribonuclease VII small subunit [Planctomycetes bacterium]|nr:exodeoxyribonuclease VII small subunit [Planctomycetota bacterium]